MERCVAVSLLRIFCALVIFWVSVPLCEAEPLDAQEPPPHADSLPVQMGVLVVDLLQIDDVDQSFEAVVIVRLAWRDPRLASGTEGTRSLPLEEVWSPRFVITNEIQTRTQFRDMVQVEPDGTVVYMQRFAGRYYSPLDLREFPFDTQVLQLRVTFPDFEPESLALVPDLQYTGILGGASASQWSIGTPELRSDPIEPLANISRASILLTFEIERKPNYYIWKMIAPMVLIVFMSWTVFWISPENAGAQIGVATSSMLTLIAYRFILGNLLPRVAYLTELDLFIFGATLLVFLALLSVVLTNHLGRVQRHGTALRVDVAARWVFPCVFALMIALIFFV